MTTLHPPMPYSGGKSKTAQRIVALMPTHHHYVEPFAGALNVFFAKPPSMLETINDLDGDIAAFWRVLRTQPNDLERMCALTPHSREEYMCARTPGQATDDLTRAWRTWVRLTQARGSRSNGTSGWKFVAGGGQKMALAKYLDGYVARIMPCAERLRSASIENRSAVDVILCYDQPGTLFYLDPPYLASTREHTIYTVEMGAPEQHEKLLDVLQRVQGKVILSGYRSDLYDTTLAGWNRVDMPAHAMTGAKRIESVWLNYDPPSTLLDVGNKL